MKFWLVFLFILFCIVGYNGFSQAPYVDYSSWANVKTRFGVKGDGKSDDTKAIQNALDQLAEYPLKQHVTKDPYSTLFFPEGVYLISETLRIEGNIGFNLVGESNKRIVFKWIGRDGDTMMLFNGSSYFKLAAFFFDANYKKGMICVGLNWLKRWRTKTSQSYAPLNIEFSQLSFIGRPAIGINAGTTIETGVNNNDSEVTLYNCQFYNCTEAGLKISGSNALDYWVWNSRFVDCKVGIKTFRGNYHAYYSTFENSGYTDLLNEGGYYTSVRGSRFKNSNFMSVDQGASCNPFKRIFQGNYIGETKSTSIMFYHVGKPFLLDNVFNKSHDSASPFIIDYQSWCPASYQVISLGNKFRQANPYKIKANESQKFKLLDSTITHFSHQESLSKKIRFDDNPVKTIVFEVPAGATTEKIQSVINEAVKVRYEVATVHFPYGEYIITRSIDIPAHANINIVGDSYMYGTRFKRGKGLSDKEPIFRVQGIGKVSFEEFQIISTNLSGTGIEVNGFDKPNVKARIDQLHTQAKSSIILNGLNYLYVEKNNSFYSAGDIVIGGSLINAEKGSAGLYCFGGQFAGVKVQKGGRFVAKDCWWEGSARPFLLEGEGEITLDGTMIAPVGADSNVTFEVNKFKGKISVLNTYLQGAVKVNRDNPDLRLLFLNTNFYHKVQPFDFFKKGGSYKAAALAITSQCFDKPECGSIINVPDAMINVKSRDSFLLDMLQATRKAMPKEIIRSTPSAYFYIKRVSMLQVNKAIVFNK